MNLINIKQNEPGSISILDHLIARELTLASGMTLLALESTLPFRRAPPSIAPLVWGTVSDMSSRDVKSKYRCDVCKTLIILRTIKCEFLTFLSI
jgi:hypothetical protein